MNKYIIYGLVDPFNKNVRYIGKSVSGLRRPRSHMTTSLSENTKKANWIKSLLKLNTKPDIIIIQIIEDKQSLGEAEIFWISYFKSLGAILLNGTDGGDGALGRPASQYQKDKMSKVHSGKKVSIETREKLRRANFERVYTNKTDEIKLKIAKGMGAKPFKDQFGFIYHSASQAEGLLKISRSSINDVLFKRRSSTKGYTFEYVGT